MGRNANKIDSIAVDAVSQEINRHDLLHSAFNKEHARISRPNANDSKYEISEAICRIDSSESSSLKDVLSEPESMGTVYLSPFFFRLTEFVINKIPITRVPTKCNFVQPLPILYLVISLEWSFCLLYVFFMSSTIQFDHKECKKGVEFTKERNALIDSSLYKRDMGNRVAIIAFLLICVIRKQFLVQPYHFIDFWGNRL